jgi:DNA polymerase-3 subunit delta'
VTTGALAAGAATWPVWGHGATVRTLVHAIAVDRVRHAYLVAGSDGVGKKTLALAFASALACLEPPAPGIPCGSCRSCRKIARGVHPDVQVFGLASQIAAAGKSGGKNTTLTIETVRGMTADAVLRPVESRWRVLILDDAEAMQETAQEALLKSLEEPPAYAVILLLANDAELLLPTIRSRCQTIELSPLPRGVIVHGLRERGEAPERAEALAGAANGLPGWAIRAAEQPKLLTERLASIEQAISWIEATPYERIVAAVKMGDSFTKRRPAVFRELETALGVWRDAMLLNTGQRRAVSFPSAADTIARVTGNLSLAAIHAALRSVRQCIVDLEANVRPRLAIESMVLQWPIISSHRS